MCIGASDEGAETVVISAPASSMNSTVLSRWAASTSRLCPGTWRSPG